MEIAAPARAWQATPSWWLLGPKTDVAAFAGSALLALLALAWRPGGQLAEPADVALSEWTWIACVLMVDVAHVWSTVWRTYLDPAELGRHPYRYLLVPLLGYAASVLLYSIGAACFWRTLAYLAVYHFVRQQYGWVMLYRTRCGEQGRWSRALDSATVHACALYPLAWWHAHLPRRFSWFMAGDFSSALALGPHLLDLAAMLWVGLRASYCVRSARAWQAGHGNPGKDMVMGSTAACWYLGIVTLNSDYAFTVTNVLIHGIPYMALLFAYTTAAGRAIERPLHRAASRPLTWVGLLWLVAYAEELAWDRAVWHERAWLFGAPWEASSWHLWLVPLLALPQLVHYLLDGYIWRRGEAWVPWSTPPT